MILWKKILIMDLCLLFMIMVCLHKDGIDMNELYKNPMFNPMMQYKQAYCYYRYLCMQMDYKIKCKEYEKLCGTENHSQNSRDSKVE